MFSVVHLQSFKFLAQWKKGDCWCSIWKKYVNRIAGITILLMVFARMLFEFEMIDCLYLFVSTHVSLFWWRAGKGKIRF